MQNIVYFRDMARNYPKFLFQHVTEAKSKGRFIMHLQSPTMLMLVHEEGKQIRIEAVKVYEYCKDDVARQILDRALKWYIMSQRKADAVNEDGSFDMIPKGKPIKEAYITMLEKRGVSNDIGLGRSTVSIIKRAIREEQKFPGDATMREQLTKAGWTCMQQELWAKVSIK